MKNKILFFEALATWRADHSGILSSPETDDLIDVATPVAFSNGTEGKWSPESLFLGAIRSSFMTTFLSFAKHKNLRFNDFSCDANGRVEFMHGAYSFTHIDVYPWLTIPDEETKQLGVEVMNSTIKSCLISHSILAIIVYHTSIKVMKGESHMLPDIYHEHISVSKPE